MAVKRHSGTEERAWTESSFLEFTSSTSLSDRRSRRRSLNARDPTVVSCALRRQKPEAIVCAPAIDAATERQIARELSRLSRFLVLLVAETVEADVVSRLLAAGARDYVRTSGHEADIVPRLRRLFRELPQRPASTPQGAESGPLGRIVGVSEARQALVDQIVRAAKCDLTVFIEGKTGVGKGVCAEVIHALSPRADKPFLPVSCAEFSPHLIESELFGHLRGAFTGATETRVGLVEEARGGTLFLDEIHVLPPEIQVKLLRLLQEWEFRAVGSTKTLTAEFRVIAATNVDLTQALLSGTIRADLYYRLNVFPVIIPPLCERREDILPLVEHFLLKHSPEPGRRPPDVTAGAAAKLGVWDWPGNIRELENTVKRAVVVAENPAILTERDFVLLGEGQRPFEGTLAEARSRNKRDFERRFLEAVLSAHDGNVTHAARSAGVKRSTFQQMMRRHGIDARAFRPDSRRK